MSRTYLDLFKKERIQLVYAIIVFFLTVILPFLSYLQISPVLYGKVHLEKYKHLYEISVIYSIIVGVILTISRFLKYKSQKYSIRGSLINIFNAVLIVLIFIINSPLVKIEIIEEETELYIDLSGLFLFLIILWSLFIFKSIYI